MAMNEDEIQNIIQSLENPLTPRGELVDISRELFMIEDSEKLRRFISPLIKRLTRVDDPSWVRSAMILALGEVVNVVDEVHPEATNLIVEIFTSEEDVEVKGKAALALGYMMAKEAVDLLINELKNALQKKEVSVVFCCLTALGDIGEPKAVDIISKALSTSYPSIPQTAAKALGKIGPKAQSALPALKKLADLGNESEKKFVIEAINRIER